VRRGPCERGSPVGDGQERLVREETGSVRILAYRGEAVTFLQFNVEGDLEDLRDFPGIEDKKTQIIVNKLLGGSPKTHSTLIFAL